VLVFVTDSSGFRTAIFEPLQSRPNASDPGSSFRSCRFGLLSARIFIQAQATNDCRKRASLQDERPRDNTCGQEQDLGRCESLNG
jgi:hypothetical protein